MLAHIHRFYVRGHFEIDFSIFITIAPSTRWIIHNTALSSHDFRGAGNENFTANSLLRHSISSSYVSYQGRVVWEIQVKTRDIRYT